jgi:hypothetical protein
VVTETNSSDAQLSNPGSAATIYHANRSYAAVGGLTIASLLVVGLLGYAGVNGPAVLSTGPAFFVMGSSILILAAASLYVLLTLRTTIRMVQVHGQYLANLQAGRDTAQDRRISSLEGSREGSRIHHEDGPRVAKRDNNIPPRGEAAQPPFPIHPSL